MKIPVRVQQAIMFALLALLATAASVFAATGPAAVTWTRPTTYVDGTALAPGEIIGNRIVCVFTPTGATASVPCVFTPTSVAGNAVTGNFTVTYPAQGGRACFQVVVQTQGADADPSTVTDASCKTFPALKPSPATGVTVTVTVTINWR